MTSKQLLFRNLRKNLKNYSLYVFALIFSSALYFSFVTLQYDPSMDVAEGSIKGAAAIRTASILLIAIVAIFLLYANNLFIKRRSKEIGLLQLVGMNKGMILRLLSAENFMLYFGSLLIGIFIGFSFSKLIILLLFKITGVEAIATLRFSTEALLQTLIVFCMIYLLIMLINHLFIKRHTILALFRVTSSTEEQIKKVTFLEMIMGIIGLLLIVIGYFISSKLFGGDFTTMTELFLAMVIILGSVIIGTYLFYKGSIRFIFHLIRKRKNGYLKVNEVVSLSSVMFRMKSNALLLTIITTISALAIGLLSLSYISYYSAEQTAKDYVAADFSFTDEAHASTFTETLNENGIEFEERSIEVIQVEVDLSQISDGDIEGELVEGTVLPVVSDTAIEHIDLSSSEVILSGYNDLLQNFIRLKDAGTLELNNQKFTYLGLEDEFIVSGYYTSGGLPVAIVDEKAFTKFLTEANPDIQKPSNTFYGIDIANKNQLEKANQIFNETLATSNGPHESQLNLSNNQKTNMGFMMFVVAFLGLTFLVTSGCILYFKQTGESEEEKPNYTVLRKLGFTQNDLLKGVQQKQLFNFGIPLLLGLFHSYFAVKSGWFLFGSELWTPMIVVMLLYTVLYSIFGLLSVNYYRKVIRDAL